MPAAKKTTPTNKRNKVYRTKLAMLEKQINAIPEDEVVVNVIKAEGQVFLVITRSVDA